MCPRALVVSVIAVLLLVTHPPAVHSAPLEVVAVSEEGDVFHLLHSVTVDGGEGSNDEARGISVAPDGMVYAAGYVTVAGQGRDIWLGHFDVSTVFADGFEAGDTTSWSGATQ